MKLPDGNYRTEAGSTLTLLNNGGRSLVEFDWYEEEGACCDCRVNVYPDGEYLTWHCDECAGGYAKLYPVAGPEDEDHVG